MAAHVTGSVCSRPRLIAAMLAASVAPIAMADEGYQGKPPLTTVPSYVANFVGTVAVQTAVGHDATGALDPVVRIFNLNGGPLYPVGHYNPANFRYSHAQWNRQVLGTVFGLTLDTTGNMYVGHSEIYTGIGYSQIGTVAMPVAALNTTGSIYKLNGVTANPTKFATLPQLGTGAGVGNICYNKDHNCFYTTNIHDGRIYRLNGTTGAILSTFNPSTGIVSLGGAPLAGWANVVAPLGQRIWGIERNKNRVYYSVWSTDFSNTTNPPTTIRSVQIGPGGDFIPGTDQLEVTMPQYYPSWSHPVSDIAFSDDGRMLVAERAMSTPFFTGAHDARVIEFRYVGGLWVTTTTNTNSPPTMGIPIGDYGSLTNSAGGCDYDHRVMTPVVNRRGIWATADAQLLGSLGLPVYGFCGVDRLGANALTSTNCDYDGNVANSDKTYQGDISISVPRPCMAISNENIRCIVDGNFSNGWLYTITITNTSGSAVTGVNFTISGGATLGGITVLGSPLLPGQSITMSAQIVTAPINTTICMQIELVFGPESLCKTLRCFNLSECAGLGGQLVGSGMSCVNGIVRPTLTIQNLNPTKPVTSVIITPISPAGMTVTPASQSFASVAPGNTLPPLTFIIGNVVTGQQVCYKIKLVHPDTTFDEITVCQVVPRCVTLVGPCRSCGTWSSTLSAFVQSNPGTGVREDAGMLTLYNDTSVMQFVAVHTTVGLLESSSTGDGTTDTVLGTETIMLAMPPMQFTQLPIAVPGTNPATRTGEIYIRADIEPQAQPGAIEPDRDPDSIQAVGRKSCRCATVDMDPQGDAPPVQFIDGAIGVFSTNAVMDPSVQPGTIVKVRLTPSNGLLFAGSPPGAPVVISTPLTAVGQKLMFSREVINPGMTSLPNYVVVEISTNGGVTFQTIGTHSVFSAPPPALVCIADVASDSLDTTRNPNGSVGSEDLDAFISAFIAGNASVADVASDSLDTTYNPNGSVGSEDLDAFISSFIAGCQ